MYKKAVFDLVEFDVEDVITTSEESIPPVPDCSDCDYIGN